MTSAADSHAVWVNGQPTGIVGANLDRLVADHAESPKGIAVAVNGEVVPRSQWSSRTVDAGDRIEILGAAQGG
jgi:sulfur carrier protein